MWRMNRRTLITGAAGLSLGVGLSGCSGATPSGPRGGGSNALSLWGVAGGVRQRAWESAVEAWNKVNADSAITAEYIANDAYKERIRTALGSGTNPQMFFHWGGGTLSEYVEQGKILDLTAETKQVMNRVLPSVAEQCQRDGKVFAIPNAPSNPALIFYNTELFDKIGAAPPENWDELHELVKEFNAAGIAPFAVAGASRWPYLMWIQYLTDRIGGPEAFAAVTRGEPDAWNHPAIGAALEEIQGLVRAKGFADGFASVSADAQADLALVASGQAAMMLHLSQWYSLFLDYDQDWVREGGLGYFPFPTVARGTGNPENVTGNVSNYWSLAANSTEAQAKAAMQFMNEHMMDEAHIDALIQGGQIPPVAGLSERFDDPVHGTFLSDVYSMVERAEHFQLSWDQALRPAQSQELLTKLSQIFLLEIDPSDFVSAMNKTQSAAE